MALPVVVSLQSMQIKCIYFCRICDLMIKQSGGSRWICAPIRNDGKMRTPLHYACSGDAACSIEVVDLLLQGMSMQHCQQITVRLNAIPNHGLFQSRSRWFKRGNPNGFLKWDPEH